MKPLLTTTAMAMVLSFGWASAQTQPGTGANVDVKQPAPQVTVQQPQPNVTVQQPQPQVSVQQPQPHVTVQQPQPQVSVQQAQPKVEVQQAQPKVDVQQTGQPKVDVQQTGQPKVDVQRTTDAKVNTTTTHSVSMYERLVGKDLSTTDGTNAKITNLLVAADNQVRAVIVEWGGLLGMGKSDTIVPVTDVQVNGDQAQLNVTKDQLQTLPKYEKGSQQADLRLYR